MQVQINEDTEDKIKLNREVRQEDTTSLKLLHYYTLALEDVFKKLAMEWIILNLRFADDIIIISSKLCELTEMLHQFNEALEGLGLTMNISKTKTMNLDNADINIGDQIVENDKEYVYRGHTIKPGKENQTAEI